MSRIGVVYSEPLRRHMGGIGIRCVEIARQLDRAGLEPVLVVPVEDPRDGAPVDLEVTEFRRGELGRSLAGCSAAVAQGALADDLLRELPELPTALDLYDPWLVENFHYVGELGRRPYARDLASWILQLSRGDLLLCGSQEQRHYYLGFLTALGRLDPERIAADPTLAELLAIVPFGVPEELPEHRSVLPADDSRVRVLFGAVYEWNDPDVVLAALRKLGGAELQLLVSRHPRSDSTPQRLLAGFLERADDLGSLGSGVALIDWVPADRRFDLLRDVDAMVVTHRPGLESELAFRTRVLEAMAAGCPVIVTAGGAVSRLVADHAAGAVVPPGDAAALAEALASLRDDPDLTGSRVAAGRRLAGRFTWSRCVAPLVRFCKEPRKDRWADRLGDVESILKSRRRLQSARVRWARAIRRLREPW